MSFLVLHMDKFKKEAVRGIQSHNNRERESLKILQTEFHRHLQSKGFAVQRGVEQVPGAKKKHLDTRAFKQQQEALNGLHAESGTLAREALFLVGAMAQQKEREAALQAKLQGYEEQAWEADSTIIDTCTLMLV